MATVPTPRFSRQQEPTIIQNQMPRDTPTDVSGTMPGGGQSTVRLFNPQGENSSAAQFANYSASAAPRYGVPTQPGYGGNVTIVTDQPGPAPSNQAPGTGGGTGGGGGTSAGGWQVWRPPVPQHDPQIPTGWDPGSAPGPRGPLGGGVQGGIPPWVEDRTPGPGGNPTGGTFNVAGVGLPLQDQAWINLGNPPPPPPPPPDTERPSTRMMDSTNLTTGTPGGGTTTPTGPTGGGGPWWNQPGTGFPGWTPGPGYTGQDLSGHPQFNAWLQHYGINPNDQRAVAALLTRMWGRIPDYAPPPNINLSGEAVIPTWWAGNPNAPPGWWNQGGGGGGNPIGPPAPPVQVGGGGNPIGPPAPPVQVGGGGNPIGPPAPPVQVGGGGNPIGPPAPPVQVKTSSTDSPNRFYGNAGLPGFIDPTLLQVLSQSGPGGPQPPVSPPGRGSGAGYPSNINPGIWVGGNRDELRYPPRPTR